MNKKIGKVFLVGAGPGDPDLISLKAQKLIASADVILHDALIDSEVLRWAKKSAKLVHSGKRGQDRHSVPQDTINQRMLRYARAGNIVVRLKGGDPFMFGRGSEEADFLRENNIEFEVVPATSSVTAAAVCAGIPLTDRRVSAQVTIISGHLSKGKNAIDWKKISPRGTLVIVMGVSSLEQIINKLLRLKWKASTPIACIINASTNYQVVIDGTLNSLLKRLQVQKDLIVSPAVIVIGQVVKLRK